MNDPNRQTFNLRDVAHAAILLILVPFVFYGGYKLVSLSADVDPNSVNLGTQFIEKANQVIDLSSNRSSPPPGTVWIAAVDRLRNELSSIDLLDAGKIEQRNRLDSQLRSIRQHCESHADIVHSKIDSESHLGRTINSIGDAIEQIQHSTTNAPLRESWESAFQRSESDRLAQQAEEFNALYQPQAAQMQQVHSKQIAALTRHERELADELQRTLDNIQQIERETREQVAQRQRLTAFLKDKDEIERLLKPFITPGYSQLRGNWNEWKTTTEEKPLSYRDLERLGALATDIDGVRLFARIGGMPTHMFPTSARPLGGFPAYYDSTLANPTQLETIKRAQQLIKLHSVYLIEAGLLQP